jgi:hypothetical protein
MKARVMRCFVAALLLGPGMAIAAGTETDASNEAPSPTQVVPAMKQGIAPSAAMGLQMPPIARPQVYYWVPPPGMMWPVMPQYPAPIAMPPVVWVMVPAASLTPAQVDYGPVADGPVVELPTFDAAPAQIMMQDVAPSTPAEVDYGPVADTPVVELAPPDAAITQTMMEDAALAAALAQEGNAKGGPAPVAPGVELPSPAGMDTHSPATGTREPSNLTVAVPANVAPVDYGPVTPTRVVDLLALQQQAVAASEVSKAAKKPAPKSGASRSPRPVQKAKSAPTKRICWTRGVVAPCR